MKQKELISKYVQDSLTPVEKSEFDRLMASDDNFKEEVAFHTDLKKVAGDKDDDNFRVLLSDLEAKADAPTRTNYSKWLVAASIALLVGLAYLFYPKATSNDALFADYFEPYRNITQPVVRGSDNGELRSVAFNAYENGDYKKALDMFNELLLDKEEPALLFYKANALLELDQLEKAIPILEKDLHVQDLFTEKRHWYLALAYLKVGETEKCAEQLKVLTNLPNTDYKKEEAQKLLEELD